MNLFMKQNRVTDSENELTVVMGEEWGKQIGSLGSASTVCYI